MPYETPTISSADCDRMLTAALATAEEVGRRFTVALVDPGGTLKAFVRQDGASLGSVQVAIDKAATAVRFGRATHDWYEVLQADDQLGAGARTGIDRLIVFGGGLPITVDGVVAGAIGVSGADRGAERPHPPATGTDTSSCRTDR